MRRFALMILLALLHAGAYAETDFQCVARCKQQNYSHEFCMTQCSYKDAPQDSPPATHEQAANSNPAAEPAQKKLICMADCAQKGYLEAFCQRQCPY